MDDALDSQMNERGYTMIASPHSYEEYRGMYPELAPEDLHYERYRDERIRRVPRWSGDRGKMEPKRPKEMRLAPNPRYSMSHADHVNQLRDYALYVNTMHLTHTNRPGMWGKLATRLKLGERLGTFAGLASWAAGIPVHPRLPKAAVDYAHSAYQIGNQRKMTHQMHDMHDLLPMHIYLDEETGHLVTLLDDVDPPDNLHARISDYERIHGAVPNKYLEWEERLVDIDQKLAKMQNENILTVGAEVLKDILFDFIELGKIRERILGAITPEFLAAGDVNLLQDHLPTWMFSSETAGVEKKAYKVLGEQIGLDDKKIESLSKEMDFTDFIKYTAEKLDVDETPLISQKGIDALVRTNIIPDGAIPGTISNPRKLMDMGAPDPVIEAANKPATPVLDQASRIAAAEIEKHQSKPVPPEQLKPTVTESKMRDIFKDVKVKPLSSRIPKGMHRDAALDRRFEAFKKKVRARREQPYDWDPEKQAEHFRNRSAAMDKSFNDEMNKLVKAEREQWQKEEREDRARWDKEKEWGTKEGQARHTGEFDRYRDQLKRKHDRAERRKNLPADVQKPHEGFKLSDNYKDDSGDPEDSIEVDDNFNNVPVKKSQSAIRLEARQILLEDLDPDDDPDPSDPSDSEESPEDSSDDISRNIEGLDNLAILGAWGVGAASIGMAKEQNPFTVNDDIRKWNITDYVNAYERNVTHAYAFASYSYGTLPVNARPSHLYQFERDVKMENPHFAVYHDKKSSTAWFVSCPTV